MIIVRSVVKRFDSSPVRGTKMFPMWETFLKLMLRPLDNIQRFFNSKAGFSDASNEQLSSLAAIKLFPNKVTGLYMS